MGHWPSGAFSFNQNSLCRNETASNRNYEVNLFGHFMNEIDWNLISSHRINTLPNRPVMRIRKIITLRALATHTTIFLEQLLERIYNKLYGEFLFWSLLTTLVVHCRDQERISAACSCDILQICHSAPWPYHFWQSCRHCSRIPVQPELFWCWFYCKSENNFSYL